MIQWELVPGYVTGASALSNNALSRFESSYLQIATDNPDIDNDGGVRIGYLYDPDYDKKNFLKLLPGTQLYLPNRERSLIDYIRMIKKNSEEHLIQGLDDYLRLEGNYTKLYEMADFYHMPHETLDYWIKETEDEYLH
jgi:hypothetical protein